jgi:hypothetical protein
MEVTGGAHDDFHYEIATVNRAGIVHKHAYASAEPLGPGDVLRLEGRFWIIETIDQPGERQARATAKPARYRLRLRYSDGREEVGAMRRYRPEAPRIGHSFVTSSGNGPVSWQVVDAQLDRDDEGPFLSLTAERDFAEVEDIPDHDLEHELAEHADDSLPEEAEALIARAARENLELELVVLDPGEEPSWDDAARFLEALILDEIEDDLLEQCGVDPDNDPRDTWLATVKDRLRSDLASFRRDVEELHDQIEQWTYRDARVFASVGTFADEADPDSGHGWLCRLLDASVLGAAGFVRVQKVRLEPGIV